VLLIGCVQFRKRVFVANLGAAHSIRLSEPGVRLGAGEIRRSGLR
jgi:hypothetical protein